MAEAFLIYALGSVILRLAYFVFRIAYAKKQTLFRTLLLAILPTPLFLLSGLTMRHRLPVGFAVLFGAAQIFITVLNTRMSAERET